MFNLVSNDAFSALCSVSSVGKVSAVSIVKVTIASSISFWK